MEFSEGQLAAVVEQADTGIARFDRLLEQLPVVAEDALRHWYVPAALRDEVRWLVRQAVQSGQRISALIRELLTGAAAPIELLRFAWRWRDVQGRASAVAGALNTQNLVVDDSAWSGPARNAYLATALGQSAAALRLGVIADGTAGALTECVAAGAALYVTLAVIVTRLVVAAVAALAAFGTAVFCWAGAALIVEEAGISAATISTALSGLAVCLAGQARVMTALHGTVLDQTSFPSGEWPRANTGRYDDATVTDGDADWSLAG